MGGILEAFDIGDTETDMNHRQMIEYCTWRPVSWSAFLSPVAFTLPIQRLIVLSYNKIYEI